MMRRILLAAVLALAATGSTQAGPLRNVREAVQEWRQARQDRRSGCSSGCASAQQAAPPVTQQVVQTSHTTGTQYQPIRLGYVLPTCVNGQCGR